MSLSLNDLVTAAFENSAAHGFWSDCEVEGGSTTELDRNRVRVKIPEKLMLVVTEIAEAMEAYRDGVLEAVGVGPWEYGDPYQVPGNEDPVPGEHGPYWRAEAIPVGRPHQIVMGVGATPEEAARTLRANVASKDTFKPEGFPIEIADTLIRLFDLCGALGIDLEAAVEAKMRYNLTRPFRHGGKRA